GAVEPASGLAVLGARDVDIEITGLLGEGGMGRVMLARQRSLDRKVAVKMLKPGSDADAVRGLFTEAVVTGSIDPPTGAPIHVRGRDDGGRPVLVMKRVEGVSWKKLVDDPHHPAWTKIAPAGDDRLSAHLEILIQVSNAVHFAHTRGFVHRDIKLANVMIG